MTSMKDVVDKLDDLIADAMRLRVEANETVSKATQVASTALNHEVGLKEIGTIISLAQEGGMFFIDGVEIEGLELEVFSGKQILTFVPFIDQPVTFFINGQKHLVEDSPPYSLGGSDDGKAKPFDFNLLPPGMHEIHANEGHLQFVTQEIVGNPGSWFVDGVEVVETPLTISGEHVLTFAPEKEAPQTFFLGGAFFRIEGHPPYSLGGKDTEDKPKPFNFNSLVDGAQSIEANENLLSVIIEQPPTAFGKWVIDGVEATSNTLTLDGEKEVLFVPEKEEPITFLVNGLVLRTEKKSPYSLGAKSSGVPKTFNFNILESGSHIITASGANRSSELNVKTEQGPPVVIPGAWPLREATWLWALAGQPRGGPPTEASTYLNNKVVSRVKAAREAAKFPEATCNGIVIRLANAHISRGPGDLYSWVVPLVNEIHNILKGQFGPRFQIGAELMENTFNDLKADPATVSPRFMHSDPAYGEGSHGGRPFGVGPYRSNPSQWSATRFTPAWSDHLIAIYRLLFEGTDISFMRTQETSLQLILSQTPNWPGGEGYQDMKIEQYDRLNDLVKQYGVIISHSGTHWHMPNGSQSRERFWDAGIDRGWVAGYGGPDIAIDANLAAEHNIDYDGPRVGNSSAVSLTRDYASFLKSARQPWVNSIQNSTLGHRDMNLEAFDAIMQIFVKNGGQILEPASQSRWDTIIVEWLKLGKPVPIVSQL